jgi:hypothetical protein
MSLAVSRDVQKDAGGQCDKTAVLRDKTKGTRVVVTNLGGPNSNCWSFILL